MFKLWKPHLKGWYNVTQKILGHPEAAEKKIKKKWFYEKILLNMEKTRTEIPIMLPNKTHSDSAWKVKDVCEDKDSINSCIFQDFSRKQVSICTWQKTKQYFLKVGKMPL